jgi:hypothetical protein
VDLIRQWAIFNDDYYDMLSQWYNPSDGSNGTLTLTESVCQWMRTHVDRWKRWVHNTPLPHLQRMTPAFRVILVALTAFLLISCVSYLRSARSRFVT